MTAKHENGRPTEAVKFASDAGRWMLPATEDDPDDQLRALRERIRALQEPIQIKEENS